MAATEHLLRQGSFPAFFGIVAIATLVIRYLYPDLFSQSPISKLPYVGTHVGLPIQKKISFMTNARKLLRDGYRKFHIYRTETALGQCVFLSRDSMVELLKKPDEVINFEKVVIKDFECKLTKLASSEPIVPHTIRSDLTPGLVRIIPRVAIEVARTIDNELPATDSWTAHNIYDKLLRIVAISAGSAFLGPESCHSEEWIQSAVGYTIDVVTGAVILKLFPSFLRPLAAKFVPAIKRVDRHRAGISRMMVPIIRERKEKANTPGYEKPDDMLQWMLDKAPEYGIENDEEMAYVQLGVGLVSIHSTTSTATQALYDLAARPEYFQPLRDEIAKALQESGGDFTKDSLYSCKLLDSFMKESQRMSPISMVIGKRILEEDVQLSNGVFLPKGTLVASPAEAVGNDPAHFENPDEFDGYRFYRLRQKGGLQGNLNQMVTANKQNLAFGYGKHACPGRFFAVAEIKLIVAHILLNYDIELADKSVGRYPNKFHGDACTPDTSKQLLFRKRLSGQSEI
ncbi:cytochrome P450 [Eremomyces bilateralis CBS 781.70]|uniref:Cytochrome P450 n=1 Tax=Eremomyces bilateralis CBS 781.70 TaxID=1392243 RepID=A0A6G1GCR9_9PEZI|nr:cytochrome P450 [Eremomyces bilateralis CBS 781.70]KAF1815691.1 cytochrome P450 [Eremomyces bilateralis CBS 781.70]